MSLPDKLWVALIMVITRGIPISSTGSIINPILLSMCSFSSPLCYRLQAKTLTAGQNPIIKQIQLVLGSPRWQNPGPAHEDTAGVVEKNFISALSGPPCCTVLGSIMNIGVLCCSILDQHRNHRSYTCPLSQAMARWRLWDCRVMKIRLHVGSL